MAEIVLTPGEESIDLEEQLAWVVDPALALHGSPARALQGTARIALRRAIVAERERDQAIRVACERAGADPAVRRVLLDEIGTTEAGELAESLRLRREHVKALRYLLGTVRCVLWDAQSVAEVRYSSDVGTDSPWPELRELVAKVHVLLG